MSWIKRILYGVLIGVASIAPGISGGTIAIALGFYESLINAVADLLKHFKKNFLYLLPYGIGALVSMAALSVVINFFFIRFPLPTSTLFIGFILGTLPFIRGKFRQSLEMTHECRRKASHVITMAIFFLIVLIPLFFKGSIGQVNLSGDFLSVLSLVGVGVIAAATLVIPGLSGTMILTAIGYYKPLLSIASTFVTALVSLNLSAALEQLIFIVPLGIGVIVGAFLLAKLVSFLFRTIPSYVYAAITGLIIATPIVMLADINPARISVLSVLCAIVTLAAGLLLIHFLGEEE